MKSWTKHIKINHKLLIAIVFFILVSCEKNDIKNEVVIAQVGNSKLNEKELDSFLSDNMDVTKYKKEFVKNWIETEVLNQVAVEQNLLNQDNYYKILSNTKKELAAVIAIREFLKKKKINFSNEELLSFFKKTKNDYKNSSKIYVVNIISFNNEAKAINFRNKGIQIGWDKAVNLFKNDSSVIEIGINKVYQDFHIQSKVLSRILKGQYLNEISPVIKTELNNFVVVQQIDKIDKNSIPKFKYLKDKVRERYLMLKQKELVRFFIDSLITEKKVKIY